MFSATFVPADTYPDVVRWLLPLTPLYHGVELLRAFTLGDAHRVVHLEKGELSFAQMPRQQR